ncbi:MAG: hypothetical protein AAB299_03160, partial [Thermodesulfobacteriota bacterium]
IFQQRSFSESHVPGPQPLEESMLVRNFLPAIALENLAAVIRRAVNSDIPESIKAARRIRKALKEKTSIIRSFV